MAFEATILGRYSVSFLKCQVCESLQPQRPFWIAESYTVAIGATDTGAMVRVLEGHLDQVNSVAFSSNGSDLVSGSGDNTVRLWNKDTGEVIRILEGHSEGVTSIAFSSDGTQAVTGSVDCTVRIWEMTTGEISRTLRGHQNWVFSVAFSYNGSRVVSGSTDGSVRIWNIERRHILGECSIPDLPIMDNHTRNIWNTILDTARWEADVMQADDLYDVSCVAFSPDGSYIVSGSQDTVQIWRTSTGKFVRLLKGHSMDVTCAAFSPCGNLIVSGSKDKSVRIWNVAKDEPELVLDGHSNWVMCVAFSSDGSYVVSGSWDNAVRIWNTATWAGRVLEGHSDWVRAAAFSRDSGRVVSASDDGTVRIWSVATGDVECVLQEDRDLVICVAFLPDDNRVVYGGRSSIIRIWDPTTDTVSIQLPGESRINPLGHGRFQILDPIDQEVVPPASLSPDLKRLLGRSPTQDVWVAAEYRGHAIDFSGTKVCIGHRGGVAILDLATVS